MVAKWGPRLCPLKSSPICIGQEADNHLQNLFDQHCDGKDNGEWAIEYLRLMSENRLGHT